MPLLLAAATISLHSSNCIKLLIMGKPVQLYLDFELPAAEASALYNTTWLCLQHLPTSGCQAAASSGGPGGPVADADPAEPAVKGP